MTNKELYPPNRALLASVEKVCKLSDPYAPSAEIDLAFIQAMKEITRWHQEKSPFYRQFVKDSGFDLNQWNGDISKLPSIPAEFFKYHAIKTVTDDNVHINLTSSGTSGQKSQMFFDQWSLGSAQKMVDLIFSYYGWITPETKANYLLYSYQTEADSRLGTSFTDNFLTKYAPVNRVDYALKMTGKGSHDFDVFGAIRTLQEYEVQGLPVRIFGFPSFFYFTLQRMKDLKYKPLKLSAESLVFLGGGWKGYANQEIKKSDLYTLAEEMLGIPNERLRDGFGSVEHCIPYIECTNHHFHIPVYSKVLIRDLKDLSVVGYDRPGFLQFVSPYITSAPAHSVTMGDLAKLHTAESCGCGLKTDWFEILGRAGVSKNKSCAIAAAELLKDFT
jgi:phenylacetate-coenzyme A ligase PaaK-like adenylate-forming protein